MSRFLVTGGCGFIGSHLVPGLIDSGHSVVVLDNLSSGRLENLDPRANFIRASITDAEAVRAAIRGVDGCFHLAAIASVARSVLDWVGTHETNLTGTIQIFDAARRAGAVPVVYASSAAVYGNACDKPLRESDPANPVSAYGADKLACELHAGIAWSQFHLPTVGLRFFNVYGARQDPRSPYAGVISVFAEQISKGLPIEIHGDGMQVRDFVHVSDVVVCLLAAMNRADRGSRVFNVCTGMATSITGLAHLIAEQLSAGLVINHGSCRPGDIRRSIGSPDAAAAALGVQPLTKVQDGLATLMTGWRALVPC